MIDCSECKNIYSHKIMWGEFWCKKFNKKYIVCMS